MNSWAKHLGISCGLLIFVSSFAAYKIWSYGPRGNVAPPEAVSGNQVTPQLPPIHETFDSLKRDIALIVASREEGVNPFHTAHFEPPEPPPSEPKEPDPPPPPPPPPSPPPPPPVTKSVPVRYQGYFETTDGARRAYLRKEDQLMILAVDEAVVDEWKVSEIAPRKLVLVDGNGGEVTLEFNKPSEIEVRIEKKK